MPASQTKTGANSWLCLLRWHWVTQVWVCVWRPKGSCPWSGPNEHWDFYDLSAWSSIEGLLKSIAGIKAAKISHRSHIFGEHAEFGKTSSNISYTDIHPDVKSSRRDSVAWQFMHILNMYLCNYIHTYLFMFALPLPPPCWVTTVSQGDNSYVHPTAETTKWLPSGFSDFFQDCCLIGGSLAFFCSDGKNAGFQEEWT